jgi:hypothetical protein
VNNPVSKPCHGHKSVFHFRPEYFFATEQAESFRICLRHIVCFASNDMIADINHCLNSSLQVILCRIGEIIFEKDYILTSNYIERVLKFYGDYAPVLNKFDREMLGKEISDHEF